MKTFREKVAVITGAGSGIGRYLAILLAKDGADICVCDINEEGLNETVTMLRKYNISVSSHLLDVSDKESLEALPQKVIDQHGKVCSINTLCMVEPTISLEKNGQKCIPIIPCQ